MVKAVKFLQVHLQPDLPFVLAISVPWLKGLTLTISEMQGSERIHSQMLQRGQTLTIKDILGADARILLICLASSSE